MKRDNLSQKKRQFILSKENSFKKDNSSYGKIQFISKRDNLSHKKIIHLKKERIYLIKRDNLSQRDNSFSRWFSPLRAIFFLDKLSLYEINLSLFEINGLFCEINYYF